MDPGADAGARRRAPRGGGAKAGRGAHGGGVGRSRNLTVLTALAPAKINLLLHVGPPAEDGYHPICSLVSFADVGDRLTVQPSDRLSLSVTGPFAAALDGEGDNLVLRALRALGETAGIGELPLAVTLEKHLPIAAGLGGGSSDAATALRLADTALGLGCDPATLAEVSRVIGADGPMCLNRRTAWAEGIGDVLTDAPEVPALAALLINPGVPSSTGRVYRAYDDRGPRRADRPSPPPTWSVRDVIDWLARQRNDLEPVALELEPRIGAPLERLRRTSGARLARMSGSGATVFGLFETLEDARRAGREIEADHPDWWMRSTLLDGPYSEA